MAPKKTTRSQPKRLSLSTLETWVCHLMIQHGKPELVGEITGLTTVEVAGMLRRKHVDAYMATYNDIFMEKMADAEVLALRKIGVTRESIVEQLMYLANMPPERTRGNIEGQVKALIQVSLLLGLQIDVSKLPEQLRNMTDQQLREYAASGPVQ